MTAAHCRHPYVTSAARCLHCNADCSQQLAAAVRTLNAEIARSLASGPHSPSNGHPSTGIGVQIATDPGHAPRRGGSEFFCTTARYGGS